jgi:dCMP deaminase
VRSNCQRRVVGAVIVVGDRVVVTGYNGTPSGLTNCLDGGCIRCGRDDIWELGTAYDLCVCVHAEANCIATAARFGIAVAGGTLYTTHQPCMQCSKELVQAGITKVWYADPIEAPDARAQPDLRRVAQELSVEPLGG